LKRSNHHIWNRCRNIWSWRQCKTVCIHGWVGD